MYEVMKKNPESVDSMIQDLLTVIASAAVTIRDCPEKSQEMVSFLFEAIDRYKREKTKQKHTFMENLREASPDSNEPA